jgi:hypothetical protein
MTEPTVVRSIADDRIVDAENKIATAQTITSAAQTEMATAASRSANLYAEVVVNAQAEMASAQTATSVAQQQIASAAAKLANLDDIPLPDYSVWLSAAAARSQHPNVTTASLPEVLLYADKILAAYKLRFPRPDPTATAASTGAGYLPDLNVTLFKPVTDK